MASKRLTDISSATGVTLSDLIHIVITGDTSQDPAGSSYKVSLQQVYDAFALTGTSTNIYNSDGNLTGDRTVSQGSFDLDFIGDENSRLKTVYTSGTNPLDYGIFETTSFSTNILHNDNTNDTNFGANLLPGNSSMNVGLISTNESAGINFNAYNSLLFHYDGTGTTRTVSADINGVSINLSSGFGYYFPNTDGTNGQVMTTDGAGNTSWQSPTFIFTGNTSATCITDLYVTNLNSCSPLHIQPTNTGDVYIGENGGVNVGIGTSSTTAQLTVKGSGTTITTKTASFKDGNGVEFFKLTDDRTFDYNGIAKGEGSTNSFTSIIPLSSPATWYSGVYVNTTNLEPSAYFKGFCSNVTGSNGIAGTFTNNSAGINTSLSNWGGWGLETTGGVFVNGNKIYVKGDGTGATYNTEMVNNSGEALLHVVNNGKVGVNTSTPNIKLDVNGDFGHRSEPRDLTTVDNHNVSTNGTSFLVYSANSASNITGFADGYDGKRLIVFNRGSEAITLYNQNSSSSASNRMIIYNYNVGGGLADWSLNQGDCIQFVYAGSISKWIKIN